MSAPEDSYFVDDDLIGGDSDANSSDSSDSESDVSSVGDVAIADEEEEEIEEEESDEEEDDDDSDDDDLGGGQVGGIGDEEPEDQIQKYEEEEELEKHNVRFTKSGKKIKKIPAKRIVKKAFSDELSDDEDEDDDGEMYLKKFDREINENYIVNNHPECALQNYDEILSMTKVVRDSNNIIIDDLHRTNPFLTKYERARILGQRAKQIETGASPFVKVPENIIDSYLIAEMELQQGRIPFIIRRPMPNGGSEYWKISDLENIAF
jgi:DNA-directed RNA polymerase I, II, and III subunit RPABC2